ncbi:hypothetical protein [Streptomyces sp. NPDC001422]|uniref:hypothetical protein n=1 Tax=Streptomyces sp. NPDC001422 TaxID=3364575 RepID=UPI003679CD7D
MTLDPRSPSMALWHRLLGAGVSEDEARTLMNGYARELAERQRHHFGVGDAPVRAHCDPDCDFCRGVTDAAALIDPQAQRATTEGDLT